MWNVLQFTLKWSVPYITKSMCTPTITFIHVCSLNVPFWISCYNDLHSSLLGRFFNRFMGVVVGIYVHSATGALNEIRPWSWTRRSIHESQRESLIKQLMSFVWKRNLNSWISSCVSQWQWSGDVPLLLTHWNETHCVWDRTWDPSDQDSGILMWSDLDPWDRQLDAGEIGL